MSMNMLVSPSAHFSWCIATEANLEDVAFYLFQVTGVQAGLGGISSPAGDLGRQAASAAGLGSREGLWGQIGGGRWGPWGGWQGLGGLGRGFTGPEGGLGGAGAIFSSLRAPPPTQWIYLPPLLLLPSLQLPVLANATGWSAGGGEGRGGDRELK